MVFGSWRVPQSPRSGSKRPLERSWSSLGSYLRRGRPREASGKPLGALLERSWAEKIVQSLLERSWSQLETGFSGKEVLDQVGAVTPPLRTSPKVGASPQGKQLQSRQARFPLLRGGPTHPTSTPPWVLRTKVFPTSLALKRAFRYPV